MSVQLQRNQQLHSRDKDSMQDSEVSVAKIDRWDPSLERLREGDGGAGCVVLSLGA